MALEAEEHDYDEGGIDYLKANDIENLLAQQELLKQRLSALGHTEDAEETDGKLKVTQKAAAKKPKKVGKFSALAKENGFDDPVSNEDPQSNKPARTKVGQSYKVVYRPKIAVRQFPKLTAPAVNTLAYGEIVKLFEWDHTKKFRRIEVDRVLTPEEAKENMEEESTDIDEKKGKAPGVTRIDAWVMVEHPGMGVLLKAITEKEAHRNSPQKKPIQEEPKKNESLAGLQARVLQSVKDIPGLNEPPLKKAARAGSYQVVKSMLLNRAKIDARDSKGESAIWAAAKAGHTDVVALLLLNHADTMGFGKNGSTLVEATGDMVTNALIRKWEGEDVDRRLLEAVMRRLSKTESESKRLAKLFNIESQQQQQQQGHNNLSKVSVKESMTAAQQELLADDFDDETYEDPDYEADYEADHAALKAAVKAAHEGMTPEEARLNVRNIFREEMGKAVNSITYDVEESTSKHQRGVEESTSRHQPGVEYRVVYKSVAVRRIPHKEGEKIGTKSLGETVTMYEKDRSGQYRRIRVVPEDSPGGEEIDGWMLLESDAIGTLLQKAKDEVEEAG